MAKRFVHTHVHSDYSLIDGAAKVKDLVAAAARCEQPALALTDHGNLCGAIEFYKTAKGAGIKPLVGIDGKFHLLANGQHRVERCDGVLEDHRNVPAPPRAQVSV